MISDERQPLFVKLVNLALEDELVCWRVAVLKTARKSIHVIKSLTIS
jgi:hypothetical protein